MSRQQPTDGEVILVCSAAVGLGLLLILLGAVLDGAAALSRLTGR